MTNFKSQNKSQIPINQVPNMFESLKIRIWILPFDLAQGGELVEPLGICQLVLEIFSIKELNWTKICNTTFVTFFGDMTLDPVTNFRRIETLPINQRVLTKK
jgi:hypothetical protein